MTFERDVVFNPLKHGFSWSDDWYDYDRSAEKDSRRDRDRFAKEQRKLGKIVKVSTTRSLMSMGGIGTNRPHIELFVPIFRAVVFV